MTSVGEPIFLDAGEAALVVEFGRTLDPAIHNRVLSLDAALWDHADAGTTLPRHAARQSSLALPGAYRLWRQLVDFDDVAVVREELARYGKASTSPEESS